MGLRREDTSKPYIYTDGTMLDWHPHNYNIPVYNGTCMMLLPDRDIDAMDSDTSCELHDTGDLAFFVCKAPPQTSKGRFTLNVF